MKKTSAILISYGMLSDPPLPSPSLPIVGERGADAFHIQGCSPPFSELGEGGRGDEGHEGRIGQT